MKVLLILIFVVLSVQHSSSQDSMFVINSGTKANEVIPKRSIYYYPDFLNGKVFFRDGSISEGRMNYYLLMDEMHFISEAGDTLAVDDEPTIRLISIEKDSFYFDKGYFMLVKTNPSLKLCVKRGFRLGDKRKTAGNDNTSSTSSVTSYSSFSDGRIVRPLELNEQTILISFTEYYFADKFNRFVLAGKNELFEILPKCKKQLKEFCKSNNIDFQNKNHLEKLIYFLDRSCRSTQSTDRN